LIPQWRNRILTSVSSVLGEFQTEKKLCFDPNGGMCEIEPVFGIYHVSSGVDRCKWDFLEQQPVREGYEFRGWT